MKSFKEYFLSESTVITEEEIKGLLKKFKPSVDNISVWRRKDYTNLAVALSPDLYLYYLPNLDKVKVKFSDKYSVSYSDEYFTFFDKISDDSKTAVYAASKGKFYKEAVKFFEELQDGFISGKSYKNGELENGMVIAKKFKDMGW